MCESDAVGGKQPFQVRMSANVEEFIFSETWDHRKHYQAVFNSQFDLLPRYMPVDKPWAILADWRRWLAQTPVDERLCIRCINKFVSNGMSHYALVCDDHPVAQWQADKVKAANPTLICKVFNNFADANQWLAQAGYDMNLKPMPFDCHWLNPSKAFDDVLHELNADTSRFVTTASCFA